MHREPSREVQPQQPRVLAHAPRELTCGRLVRVGEGIGKVVYASEHWVVKRERPPREVVSLIVLWKLLRKLESAVPGKLGRRLAARPGRQIRLLRVLVHATMLVVPRSLWFTSHVRAIWKVYRRRDRRGERLAQEQLAGTGVIPDSIEFPPVEVKVAGWPGWLVVSEAVERAETTLHRRLCDLAAQGRYDQVELWLERFLELRQAAWQRGAFSVDAHLKNFGVIGDRIVLLDTGGLTNHWHEIESRLEYEETVERPHLQLGLGPVLAARPDIAARFDARWKAVVNRAVVEHHWPD